MDGFLLYIYMILYVIRTSNLFLYPTPWYFDSLIAVLFSLWRYETCHVFGCCNINPSFTIVYIYIQYTMTMDPMGWLQVSELHHRIIIIQNRRFTVPPIFVKLWKCRLLGESLYLRKLKQKFRKLDSLELNFWGAKASLPKTKTASFALKIGRTFFATTKLSTIPTIPIPSMYGIFTYIWLFLMAKYTIHGW